jgi:ABC-2 type transport system permease protein
VVAHLVRLKLTLLRNIFRRSRAQAIGAVVGIVYFSVLVAGLALILATFRGSLGAAQVVIPLAGAAGTVLWTVLPLFAFGSDPTLDPARFAVYAVPHRDLAVGLVMAALVSLPSIASIVLSAGVVVAWSHTVASTLVAVVSTAIGLLTAITTSRWVCALLTNAISSRRGRDVVAVVGLVLFGLVAPAVAITANISGGLGDLARTASVMVACSPLGWAWAAPGDVAAGHPLVGGLRLALAAGLLALVAVLWSRVLRAQVENPRAVSRSDSTASVGDGLGLLARLPGTPSGAVAARVLTYWRRDPRYLTSMAMTPVLPLALLIPFFAADVAWPPLLMGPLLSFLIGWSGHNAVSYDGDALWMHVVAGITGVDDRRGRVVPDLLLALVLVPVYGLVGVTVAGRLDLVPAAFGLSVALLGAGLGVSSVMNVLLPYPVPEPGGSPFSTPPGAAGIAIVAQSAASAGTLALSLPVILLARVAWSGSGWASWSVALLGVVIGASAAGLGTRAGARILDRRAHELLTGLRRT